MDVGGFTAILGSRAAIAVTGEGWRAFLQGLLTQDVDTLAVGEIRFAALLTPQGRLLFDLFLVGVPQGCLIDCAAERRAALIERLIIYRLRAKVDIAAAPCEVRALWRISLGGPGWLTDPRLPELGFRGYDAVPPAGALPASEAQYEQHRLQLGVPGGRDFGSDKLYPIEADFDLLAGIDFRKGCFVGQETTSRMKRRGVVKTRMAPIVVDGPPPAPGEELLAGTLRAGETLSGSEGMAMALLRLDRLDAGPLTTADGRPWSPRIPSWMSEAL